MRAAGRLCKVIEIASSAFMTLLPYKRASCNRARCYIHKDTNTLCKKLSYRNMMNLLMAGSRGLISLLRHMKG